MLGVCHVSTADGHCDESEEISDQQDKGDVGRTFYPAAFTLQTDNE